MDSYSWYLIAKAAKDYIKQSGSVAPDNTSPHRHDVKSNIRQNPIPIVEK